MLVDIGTQSRVHVIQSDCTASCNLYIALPPMQVLSPAYLGMQGQSAQVSNVSEARLKHKMQCQVTKEYVKLISKSKRPMPSSNVPFQLPPQQKAIVLHHRDECLSSFYNNI